MPILHQKSAGSPVGSRRNIAFYFEVVKDNFTNSHLGSEKALKFFSFSLFLQLRSVQLYRLSVHIVHILHVVCRWLFYSPLRFDSFADWSKGTEPTKFGSRRRLKSSPLLLVSCKRICVPRQRNCRNVQKSNKGSTDETRVFAQH